MSFADWIGSLGVFMILLAFFLNVTGRVKASDRTFILMNLAGATLACLASILIDYLPFVILEGTWAAVSLFALFRRPDQ